MVHYLKVENFYSINQEQTINFAIEGKLPQNPRFHQEKSISGAKISLVKALIGPNASGKTNMLKALAVIKWLMTESFHDSISSRRISIPHLPFAPNKKNRDAPATIKVRFEIKQVLYDYSCSFNKARLISEKLTVKDYSGQRMVAKTLFNKKWSRGQKGGQDGYRIDDVNFNLKLPKEYLENSDLGNSAIVAQAKHLGHKLSSEIWHYWDNVKTNIDADSRFAPGGRFFRMLRIIDYYDSDQDSLKRAEGMLKKYDLGIEKLEKDGRITHKFEGQEFKLPIYEESSGTQQLIKLLKVIEDVLNKGSIAVIDEFDAYLHPAMINSLVEKFLSKKSNPKYAQLVLITHNPEILEILDRQQVIVVEKNKKGASVFKSLTEFPGRPEDNLRKKYLARKYGGWPIFSS